MRADRIFQGRCAHSEKRIKSQDIPHVQTKFLRKKLGENTQRYRKNKKIMLQITLGRRELQDEDSDLQGPILESGQEKA